MRIAILGAGVAGLTTAWYLARDGHEVEVIERNHGVALETSFANGAQLSYSYVAPLAGPGVLPKVPPWLLRRDSPLRFYPAIDPHQWRWLMEFVLACNQSTSDLTTRRLLALSFYSRALMHEFVATEAIDFGYAKNGKLVVFSDAAGFDGARRLLDYQRSLGCEQVALDRAQCIALEAALGDPASALHRRLVGGIHTPSEEVGDCYRFCAGLETRLRAMGVDFRLDTSITQLHARQGRIASIGTGQGDVECDACVITLGAQSPFLVKPLGLRLPIYPLKGYSLTLPAASAAHQHHRLQTQGGVRAAGKPWNRASARGRHGRYCRLLQPDRPRAPGPARHRSETRFSGRHRLPPGHAINATVGRVTPGDAQGHADPRGDAVCKSVSQLWPRRIGLDPGAGQRPHRR